MLTPRWAKRLCTKSFFSILRESLRTSRSQEAVMPQKGMPSDRLVYCLRGTRFTDSLYQIIQAKVRAQDNEGTKGQVIAGQQETLKKRDSAAPCPGLASERTSSFAGHIPVHPISSQATAYGLDTCLGHSVPSRRLASGGRCISNAVELCRSLYRGRQQHWE